MRKTRFSIANGSEDPIYVGYSDGTNWNGFETKNLLWDAQNHTELVDAIEETYGWYVDEIKFEQKN